MRYLTFNDAIANKPYYGCSVEFYRQITSHILNMRKGHVRFIKKMYRSQIKFLGKLEKERTVKGILAKQQEMVEL